MLPNIQDLGIKGLSNLQVISTFDGSIAMMISTLAKQEALSDDEITKLKQVIDNIDEGEK